jgi:hypothetical protein
MPHRMMPEYIPLYSSVIYLWTILQALEHHPPIGRMLVAWPLVVSIVGWDRFWQVRVPQFLSSLEKLLKRSAGPKA